MVGGDCVSEVMTRGLVAASPDATFKELVDLMIHHDVGAVPVVDADGAVRGIVTETDLLTKPTFGAQRPPLRAKLQGLLSHGVLGPHASALTASDVMSTPVVTVSPAASVTAAARQMVDQGVGRLVVIDDGRLVGIVSRRDLLRSFDRSDEEIAADVQAALADLTVSEHGHRVQVAVEDGCVTLTGTVDFPSNIAVVRDTAMRVRGVVGVDTHLAAELPEPRPQGADFPEPPYELPR